MCFESTNVGTCIKRPSKQIKSPYVGDIRVDGKECLGHCPSLGLGEILKVDSEILVTKSNEGSKTDYVIQAVKDGEVWVGNVPLHANRIVKRLFEEELLIKGVCSIKPEYTCGDSRLDFYVKTTKGELFCEVKSVHIKKGQTAIFPVGYKKRGQTTVSERANKHVSGLTSMAKEGKMCMIVFVIQREDCTEFEPNWESDIVFSELLRTAHKEGVMIRSVFTSVNRDGIYLKEIKEVTSI